MFEFFTFFIFINNYFILIRTTRKVSNPFSLINIKPQTALPLLNGCNVLIREYLDPFIFWFNMARNFYWSTFFGQIISWNNLTFIKARILRKEYFNRSRFCLLDFKITFNLKNSFKNLFMFENPFKFLK